jgi:repressor LexA
VDGLTDTQLRVVRFLKDFQKREGFYATVRDVQLFMGWSSASTAYEVVLALVEKGFVERKKLTRGVTVFVATRR